MWTVLIAPFRNSSCLFGELEETTRTPSYYVDEDYPARPKIQKPLPQWSNCCGSESSTLETDVYVWRYALLVVHAIKKKKKKFRNNCNYSLTVGTAVNSSVRECVAVIVAAAWRARRVSWAADKTAAGAESRCSQLRSSVYWTNSHREVCVSWRRPYVCHWV